MPIDGGIKRAAKAIPFHAARIPSETARENPDRIGHLRPSTDQQVAGRLGTDADLTMTSAALIAPIPDLGDVTKDDAEPGRVGCFYARSDGGQWRSE
jgi:flagellar hook-length control protein FliK